MINFDQLVFFAAFMSLRLPSFTFLIIHTVSFAVGDLYFLVYLYNLLFGKYLSNLPQTPFSPNFKSMGKVFLILGLETYFLVSAAGPFLLIIIPQLFFLPFSCALRKYCRKRSNPESNGKVSCS